MTVPIGWDEHARIADNVQLVRDEQPALASVAVALVYGGLSNEDRLYIAQSPPDRLSITAVSRTLKELGIRSVTVDPGQRSFVRTLLGFDVVLPALHGPYGEDGRLQGLLDYLQKPYCGSGVAASAVSADKALSKLAMAGLGIATPRWQLADCDGAAFASTCAQVMVKPRMGGSSVGMSLACSGEGLNAAVAAAEECDPVGALIEEYVPGLSVTVGLLELPGGVLVLPPLAVRTETNKFYDADVKLDARGDQTVSFGATGLGPSALDELKSLSVRLWNGLGCRGIARIDYIVASSGVFALEVNTVPGLSYESNFVMAAERCGLRHHDVVLALMHEAVNRRRDDFPLPAITVSDLRSD